MRSRNIALGCALAGTLWFVVPPPATARAASTESASGPVAASATALAALSRPALSRPALSGPALSGPALSGPALSGPALPVAAATARKNAPALSIRTSATTYGYASRVWLTVSLGRTRGNRMVSIYASPVGLRGWLWHRGKVNSAGRLRVYFRLTRTTTFTVVFRGDARDAPARASRTVHALARVADALSGFYAKTRVGGTAYYAFHAGRMLVLHATVSPNKHGECLRPETEQWDTGSGWDEDTAYGCDSLDSGSHDSAPFNLARAAGDRYRIRGDYLRGARDLANLSANGPWLYLIVRK